MAVVSYSWNMMFSITFLLLCDRTLSQIILPDAVPQNTLSGFQCPGEEGYYPHPEQCEKYYGCFNHIPSLYTCPGQQLFDMKYHGCNWPDLTDCQDRLRPNGYPNTKTPPPPTGPTAKPFDCPLEPYDAMYQDPEDCSSFYRCVYGTSYHQTCPPPLVFNEKISRCDYKEHVTCKSNSR